MVQKRPPWWEKRLYQESLLLVRVPFIKSCGDIIITNLLKILQMYQYCTLLLYFFTKWTYCESPGGNLAPFHSKSRLSIKFFDNLITGYQWGDDWFRAGCSSFVPIKHKPRRTSVLKYCARIFPGYTPGRGNRTSGSPWMLGASPTWGWWYSAPTSGINVSYAS